jgi:hypothetical protein
MAAAGAVASLVAATSSAPFATGTLKGGCVAGVPSNMTPVGTLGGPGLPFLCLPWRTACFSFGRYPKRFPGALPTDGEGVLMATSDGHEREIRAARNQALFRSVNEKLRDLNDAVAELTETFTIACECADLTCTQMLSIPSREYLSMRVEPRRFAVLPTHVYPDLERVISESDAYAVVEKNAVAGEVAEELAPSDSH